MLFFVFMLFPFIIESKRFVVPLNSDLAIPCKENSTDKIDPKHLKSLWTYMPRTDNGQVQADGSWLIKKIQFINTGEYRCQMPDERRYSHEVIVFEQTQLDQRLLINYRLARRCDILQDARLVADVTSQLCQADALNPATGKCIFNISARCLRPRPEDLLRQDVSDEELDFPWRFSIQTGVPIQPLTDAEMRACGYEFHCMFLKRVARKQSIFDNGKARVQNAEERWFSEHTDRTRTYKRDMKSRKKASGGAVCSYEKSVPYMAAVCVMCGPNSVKAQPNDDKCTPCNPPDTYQVRYGQTECKDCPISIDDLKTTAYKDSCDMKATTTLEPSTTPPPADTGPVDDGFLAESSAGQELANMTNQLSAASKDVVKQVKSMSKRNATIVTGVLIVLLVIVSCVVFCRKGVGEGDRDELMAVVTGEEKEDYGSRKKRDKAKHKKKRKKERKKRDDDEDGEDGEDGGEKEKRKAKKRKKKSRRKDSD